MDDATTATTAGTPLYGLDVAGPYVAGETVAVIGPGPIGLATVAACKALVCRSSDPSGNRTTRA